MVIVKVKKDFITIKGHSGYAERGNDIVCASISSIVETSINAILSFDRDAVKYEMSDGYINLEILKNDETTNKLINNMLNLLGELEKDYPKNIKVERE